MSMVENAQGHGLVFSQRKRILRIVAVPGLLETGTSIGLQHIGLNYAGKRPNIENILIVFRAVAR